HVTPRDGITHHHPVGTRLEIGFGVRLRDGDTHRSQKVRHRWICRRVGARDLEAALAQQPGERCHGRSAYSDEMYVLLVHDSDYRIIVAASKIFSFTPAESVVSSASTPRGSVILPPVTWPDFKPNTMGTSSFPRTRVTTSCNV